MTAPVRNSIKLDAVRELHVVLLLEPLLLPKSLLFAPGGSIVGGLALGNGLVVVELEALGVRNGGAMAVGGTPSPFPKA